MKRPMRKSQQTLMGSLMHLNFLFSSSIWLIGGGAFVFGYIVFLILLFILPRRLANENRLQREFILDRSKLKRNQILQESTARTNEQLALFHEELETDISDTELDLNNTNEELNLQEASFEQLEQHLQKEEKDLQAFQGKISILKEKFDQENEKLRAAGAELVTRLEAAAECSAYTLRQKITQDFLTDRRLESQRLLMDLTEHIQTHSKKIAIRVISRVLSRYTPAFTWPKVSNHVEVDNPKIVELLKSDNSSLLQELSQVSEGVELAFIADKEEAELPIIKLGGGYGLYREAVRLTLEELISKGHSSWDKTSKIYEKNRLALEKIALRLGRQAVTQLHLDHVNDEILKMIGALNWRTSYRQNQYFHSLEVAQLAGILAFELGEDCAAAKRCGLLHDIGKGIDYKIEGSHAIISGDYADRFGETKAICDTIMSHHNDILLETPLSYILKTADTLSGARPGARVHLEEGYQVRLTSIDQSIRSFPGILKVAIMSGGREVHIEVNHKKVKEHELERLTKDVVKKLETEVAFPGQIKVVMTRRYEAIAVA